MTGVSPPAATHRTVSLAHRVMPVDDARATLSGPGEPVVADRRRTVEEATGLDLRGVRLHTGPAVRVAARAAGAAAFTLGRDIGIAVWPGQPIPQPLLQHELVHVAQQSPPRVPGAARVYETPAQAEEQAARLGLESPGGPRGARLATVGSYVACAPEDWLTSTPDLRQYGLSELLDELRGIDEWLARQTATTPETDRMFESKAAIESEIARRRGAIDAQDGPRRGSGKRPAHRRPATSARSRTAGTAGATDGGVAAGPAAESGLPDQTPMPRVLRERSSRQLTDPAELRQEVDAIAAWLQHPGLSKADRTTLRAELMSLAPQLGAELDRTSAQRRQSRLDRAFSGGGPGRAGLVANLKMIESIRPYAEQPGMAYVLHEGELLVFPMSTAEQVRAEAIAALDQAARRIVQLNDETEYLMQEHLRLNYEEQPYVGFVVSVFSREEPVDVQDRMLRKLSPSNAALTRYRNAAKRQSLAEMGDEVFTAAEFGSEAQEVVQDGIDKAISTAGAVVSTLTVVRDLSFAVALSVGAILAAPLVAAGAVGLGATGAGATALTAVGTGGLVGAEGYALGFTGTATGELVAGHSLRSALAAGHSEGVRVGKQGVSIGLGAGTAFGLTRNLGLAAGGLSRGATFVRTAAAQGGGNLVGGVSSGLLSPPEGMSRTEAALRGGSLGLLTAGIGAGSGVLAQSVRSPVAQRLISLGLPSATEGGLTYLQTGDLGASLTAAGTSAATSALIHNRPTGLGPEMEATAFDAGRRTRGRIDQGVSLMVSRARAFTAATMIGIADVSPSLRMGTSRTGYTLSSPDSGGFVAGPTPSRVQPNLPESQTPRPPSAATTPRAGQVTAPTAETPPPGPRISLLPTASAQGAGADFTYDYHAPPRQVVIERGRIPGAPTPVATAEPVAGTASQTPQRSVVGGSPSDVAAAIDEATHGTGQGARSPADPDELNAAHNDAAIEPEEVSTLSPRYAGDRFDAAMTEEDLSLVAQELFPRYDYDPATRGKINLKGGVPVRAAAKGSTRPDLYMRGRRAQAGDPRLPPVSLEAKNYFVGDEANYEEFVAATVKQARQRAAALPKSAQQHLVIDLRGQDVTPDFADGLRRDLVGRSEGLFRYERIYFLGLK